MPFVIPRRLLAACNVTPERTAWLGQLPEVINDLQRRWELTLGPPFDSDDVTCAWVAPATRSSGTNAVFKIGLPHMEADHEIDGLRFWDGDPTVRLLEADDDLGAMLLERCEAATSLRSVSETDQDVVIASLLRRLWRIPPIPHRFRPLSEMLKHWSAEAMTEATSSKDNGLVREGVLVFDDLAVPRSTDRLLATDLHAGNVLRAEREPWLVIDPKPFIGDPAYDLTQHLLNCPSRLLTDPHGTIARVGDLAEVDSGRVRLWLFARLATTGDNRMPDLARRLAP